MRVLRSLLGSLCVLTLLVSTPVASTDGSTARPPPDPDHGVNNSTHYTLWSGDVDDSTASKAVEESNNATSVMEALAQGTDVPHESPPQAVERWNRGDLGDFPRTTANTSIHPPNAKLTNATFVKDAGVSVFAIQPSTRVRQSPTDRPLYAAPDGVVLGTVDYRVERPDDETSGDQRVNWTIDDHHIEEVRLEIDGTVENRTAGTHTPTIEYASLAEYPGETHTVELVAEISVSVQQETRTCISQPTNGECEAWNATTEQSVETVTVRDSVDVVEYDLSVSGFEARYPDGDLGLVVYKNHPWQGYSLPDGNVRGVWRFYSASDPEWDTLVIKTDSETTESPSSLRPLQVHAYPTETGPTAVPRRNVTLLNTYGSQTRPPSLPANVNLQVVPQPYTESHGIATRSQTRTQHLSEMDLTATGLVRGVQADVTDDSFAEIPINESDLMLSVVNRSTETVTVSVNLSDRETGEPIDTSERDGYVVLDGERVNTSANGTVVKTLSRASGGVSARYEPGHWWQHDAGYVGDSDGVYVRSTDFEFVSVLYRFGILVSAFLFAVFLTGKVTGWHLWPPWRGL